MKITDPLNWSRTCSVIKHVFSPAKLPPKARAGTSRTPHANMKALATGTISAFRMSTVIGKQDFPEKRCNIYI